MNRIGVLYFIGIIVLALESYFFRNIHSVIPYIFVFWFPVIVSLFLLLKLDWKELI